MVEAERAFPWVAEVLDCLLEVAYRELELVVVMEALLEEVMEVVPVVQATQAVDMLEATEVVLQAIPVLVVDIKRQEAVLLQAQVQVPVQVQEVVRRDTPDMVITPAMRQLTEDRPDTAIMVVMLVDLQYMHRLTILHLQQERAVPVDTKELVELLMAMATVLRMLELAQEDMQVYRKDPRVVHIMVEHHNSHMA